MYIRYVIVYIFICCCCWGLFFFKFVFCYCVKFNYFLRVVIVVIGIWKLCILDIFGYEFMDGYEDFLMNVLDYEGKLVMILGNY